jgi:hypothetical protein
MKLEYYLTNCKRQVYKKINELFVSVKTFDDKTFYMELNFSKYQFNHFSDFVIKTKNKIDKIIFKTDKIYQCKYNELNKYFNDKNKLVVVNGILTLIIVGDISIMNLLLEQEYIYFSCIFDYRNMDFNCSIQNRNMTFDKTLWESEDNLIKQLFESKMKIYIYMKEYHFGKKIKKSKLKIYDFKNKKYVNDISKYVSIIYIYDSYNSCQIDFDELVNKNSITLENFTGIDVVEHMEFNFDYHNFFVEFCIFN